MCLTSSRTKSQPTVFGKSKNRVYPLLPTEEAGDAAITVSSGRGTLDVFVSSEGVAVEEATGEMISESQESCSDSLQDRAQLEIPHSVEHAPYIPLASAQEALTRVSRNCIYKSYYNISSVKMLFKIYTLMVLFKSIFLQIHQKCSYDPLINTSQAHPEEVY